MASEAVQQGYHQHQTRTLTWEASYPTTLRIKGSLLGTWPGASGQDRFHHLSKNTNISHPKNSETGLREGQSWSKVTVQGWLPAPAPKLLHVPDQPTTEVRSQELLWSGPGDSGHCSPMPFIC